jgi:hypothetical protein
MLAPFGSMQIAHSSSFLFLPILAFGIRLGIIGQNMTEMWKKGEG